MYFKKDYSIALYMRLSAEDDNEGESESIANQRKLLYDFINSKTEFENCTVNEFTDDGYTGTNTQRPGLKRLLQSLKIKEFNCVIVKDFSRLSRNYIDLGSFVDYLFPILNVRLISVNDCYDSLNNESCALDIPFKGIMNEFYSRDLSQKIKTTKRELIKNGEIKISQPFYGYKKDKSGNTYVIDEKTGCVVKFIFYCAQKGLSTVKISDLLNNKNIPAPIESKIKTVKRPNKKYFWNPSKIRDILKDERYTGTLILGRYTTNEIRKPTKTPENEWYKFYGRFEPLIDERLFFSVQKILYKNKKPAKTDRKEYHAFYGKVFCGVCGNTLYHAGSGRNPYFYCKNARIDKKSNCFKETIKSSIIENIVLNIIKFHSNCDIEYLINNKTDIEKSINKLQYSKIKAYEEYKLGKITKSEYLSQCEILKDKENNLFTEKEKTSKNYSEIDREFILRCAVKAFIDKIIVYNTKNIEIIFSFYCPNISN